MEITKLTLDREQGLITFMDGVKEVTFKTLYRDSEMDKLTSEGRDLLSSRVILSEDDYSRGCERASDLESRFYKDIDKLGPSYKEEIERIDLDVSFEAGGSRRNKGGLARVKDLSNRMCLVYGFDRACVVLSLFLEHWICYMIRGLGQQLVSEPGFDPGTCRLWAHHASAAFYTIAKPTTETKDAVPTHKVPETYNNTSLENRAYFDAEVEAIHMILSGIGDEIYSIVYACTTAQEMWVAIERLQQGESLNKQDVKTNLFWEFGKFTSRDWELIESYYLRFYKIMNEMVRNKLKVAMMQVNVQFLQQLQPEWSRFVTFVKQTQDLNTESYHKLFDILKQYQNEVNEMQITSSKSHATTKNKDKEVVKLVTPPSESASEEDSDEEQA
ncbi:hypothetical protein Tco_0528878 [Tanacetum coccineum]